MAQIEEEAREQLKKTYNNTFDFLDKMDRDDRAAEYFNAMMSVADPHTEYFPPEDKENFDIRMSGKLEGIGAQLQQADGVIKVSRIVPGSASWKQKDLKAEDIILKVAQGEDEPVDVTSMPLKDAVQLIRGEKGSEVRLTVKKPDGVITVIPIIRDVVILEENFAKSAIIEEKGKKFGYIKLPSFYADFAKSGGRNSAVDVRLELEKLKQQGAEEMILDLRFNGGGSLGDAIDMSGLFIKDGPVVQVKTKAAKTKVYEDQDDNVVWDGDLVILVNRFSASASEILAGALQDYKRAIIVGTPSTYGKGTVQRFIDLDRMLQGNRVEYKPLGSLKLTIQKFYRVTGKSTQWKGVESDIVLPDVYTFMDGEKDAKFALPWDEIKSVQFDKWKDNPDVNKLRKKSQKRVGKSEVFSMIAENGKRLKEQREETMLSLNYETYMKEQERLQAEAKKFDNIGKSHDDWKVIPTKSNVKNEAMDKNRKDLNIAWQKEIKKDEVIAEALNILRDM
jgi:carboxyl-terminal processing protease